MAKVSLVHEHSKAINRGFLLMPQSQSRRVKIRVSPDVWLRFNGKSWNYKRLRESYVTLSCPNAEQAELAVNAILAFAASLDGKWLAPAPEDQAAPTPGLKQGL